MGGDPVLNKLIAGFTNDGTPLSATIGSKMEHGVVILTAAMIANENLASSMDAEDARIKMSCHEHAIKDFDLQLEMNGLQMEMLMEDGKVLDYHMDEYEDLEQKKLKLLVGKRFHQNACNAYWYWIQREKSGK